MIQRARHAPPALGVLGFEAVSSEHPARVYRRSESGAMIVLAKRSSTDLDSSADLLSARRHLVEWGLLDDDTFEEFAFTGALPARR